MVISAMFLILVSVSALLIVFILNLFRVTGVVWGKIRGHRLVYLASEKTIHKTFAITDPWGNLRAPSDFGNSPTWVVLNEDGTVSGHYEHKKWKWA